jgi:glycosyltransferase involved in cell wall biosynthesis
MKSIHILGSRQYGGADKFYVRLVEALNQAGHEAVAVNRPGSPVAQALQARGVRQYHVPLANNWDIGSRMQLAGILRQERPSVVQTYMGRATRLTRVPRALGIPHIARLGGYYKLKGYYEHCDAWIGNTHGIREYLRQGGFPADRTFWIGNFVPEPRVPSPWEQQALRRRYGIPDGAPVVMSLGRFIEKKGFVDLLEALATVPATRDGRPIHLLLVGDGRLGPELHERANALGLAGRVHWPGWQNEPDPFFGSSDLFVCPSRHEPLGNVVLEAWNHALPVISTDSDGPRELITHGETGWLCPVGHPSTLAERIQSVLQMDPLTRAAVGLAGRQALQAAHGQEAVVQRYHELYEHMIHRARRRP